MDPSYKTTYKNKKLNPHNLNKNISDLFEDYDLDKRYSYEEILFILDQKCQSGKCDRDVAKELFDQSCNSRKKATLNQIIFKYVQNLQISKLCLERESSSLNRIKSKIEGLKNRKKSYVYLKIIQATVHARYSSVPSFSYKIQPSDIPPVTVVNSINPVLNHEYTLQMDTNSFNIIFYESGVKIEEWTWPDCEQAKQEGEYHRNIMSESISFEVKIKYHPINSNPERTNLLKQSEEKKKSLELEEPAFGRLCQFQPFLKPSLIRSKAPQNSVETYHFTDRIFEFLPFLRRHVRNLYYILLLLIIFECLACIEWQMEFIDITLAFGAISMLYDQGEIDLGMESLVLIMGMVLLIIKSIWGLAISDDKQKHFEIFLLMAIVCKIFVIFFAFMVSARKQEVPQQRKQEFYDQVDPKIVVHRKEEVKVGDQLSIYYN